MAFIVFILIFVFWLIARTVVLYNANSSLTWVRCLINHQTNLEIVWTLIPTLILLAVAIPSFVLLYAIDEQAQCVLILKVIGNQWYWSYEIFYKTSNITLPIEFETYMLSEKDLTEETPFRLLEIDNKVQLPCNINLKILVTSTDVLHSWAVVLKKKLN